MKHPFVLTTTLITIAILAFFNSAVNAQAKYYPGYVILLNGDTVQGEVKKNPKKEFDNFTKASFRKKEGSEIKSYSATKIKEYSVDGVSFVSRSIENEQQFIKLISKGSINLYEVQLEAMQMNDIKIKTEYYMEKAGETSPVKIKSSKFKKQISDIMIDNDEIIQKLEDKTYHYENVIEVFDAYNKAAKN